MVLQVIGVKRSVLDLSFTFAIRNQFLAYASKVSTGASTTSAGGVGVPARPPARIVVRKVSAFSNPVPTREILGSTLQRFCLLSPKLSLDDR